MVEPRFGFLQIECLTDFVPFVAERRERGFSACVRKGDFGRHAFDAGPGRSAGDRELLCSGDGTAQPRTLPEALRNLAVQPDRPAAGVDFGELHLQVTGQPGVVEVAGCDVFAGRFAQEFGQRVGERLFAEDPSRLERFAEAFDRLRDRARLLADGLRQRTDQQFDLVAEPARNEVVERPARQQVHAVGGDDQCHAVIRLAGVELVVEPELLPGESQAVRVVAGVPLHELLLHRIGARNRIILRIAFYRLFQAPRRIDVGREQQQIVLRHRAGIEHRPGTAQLLLQLRKRAEHLDMVFNPGSGEVQFAGRQRFADEDFARLDRMALRIVNAPPVVDQQPAERQPFAGVDETRFRVPLRQVVDFRAEMRRGDFEVFRLDFGVLPREEAAGFDQRERQQPGRNRLLLRQPGPREDQEFLPAGAEKVLLLRHIVRDMARNSGQNRLMKLIVGRVFDDLRALRHCST